MAELSKNDLANLPKRFLEVDTKNGFNTRAEIAEIAGVSAQVSLEI